MNHIQLSTGESISQLPLLFYSVDERAIIDPTGSSLLDRKF